MQGTYQNELPELNQLRWHNFESEMSFYPKGLFGKLRNGRKRWKHENKTQLCNRRQVNGHRNFLKALSTCACQILKLQCLSLYAVNFLLSTVSSGKHLLLSPKKGILFGRKTASDERCKYLRVYCLHVFCKIILPNELKQLHLDGQSTTCCVSWNRHVTSTRNEAGCSIMRTYGHPESFLTLALLVGQLWPSFASAGIVQ